MKLIRYTIYGLIALVAFFVAIANLHVVDLTLIPPQIGFIQAWSIQVPLFVIIIVSLVLGLVLGLLWENIRSLSSRSARNRAERQLRAAQMELEKLKRKTGETDDEVLAILNS